MEDFLMKINVSSWRVTCQKQYTDRQAWWWENKANKVCDCELVFKKAAYIVLAASRGIEAKHWTIACQTRFPRQREAVTASAAPLCFVLAKKSALFSGVDRMVCQVQASVRAGQRRHKGSWWHGHDEIISVFLLWKGSIAFHVRTRIIHDPLTSVEYCWTESIFAYWHADNFLIINLICWLLPRHYWDINWQQKKL